ncbi:hypothetical protein CROQUDRAFT_104884 [Cronartium quercuum f. sp. fusiforme G11]|uniref:Uncharacterized protein n=1 Tax=Cronartium quercuum f. sp. fusiforme G11 TaxID=708437 RepID=A0A9P6NPC0_9BASI|nr:hypothetical protein CROQUDRAFT_104884 [Cronartium quercuum f. sp. fusiforme G11]
MGQKWASSGTTQYGKEKPKSTGQVQPGGHVTELRSHGTPISRLLPGHAEPSERSRGRYRACIMLEIDLLSSRSGRELEDTTMVVISFLTPFAASNPTLGWYWGPKLDLVNSFLRRYDQVCDFCLILIEEDKYIDLETTEASQEGLG